MKENYQKQEEVCPSKLARHVPVWGTGGIKRYLGVKGLI